MACAERARAADPVALRFGRRAKEYERHALLQREVAQTLADFSAECIKAQVGLPGPGPVVEIGCGTGLFTGLFTGLLTAMLTQNMGEAPRPYLATDIAPEMVAACRARFAQTSGLGFAVLDGQTARFATPPAAIVSNLAFQWFAQPARDIARLASQTPLLAFSVMVEGSFPEWHAAFADLGRTSGLIPLPAEADIIAALRRMPPSANLATNGAANYSANPVGNPATLRFETRTHTQHYESAKAFVDSFRGIGADQPRPGYRPAPIRPVLRRFAGGMDATARVLYCVVQRGGGLAGCTGEESA